MSGIYTFETELPFANSVEDLIAQHLDPLFAQEPAWKPSPWPLFQKDDIPVLHYWMKNGRDKFYDLLLEKIGVRGETPVIVDAVAMIRRDHFGLSKLDDDVTDEDRRYFLDLAAEYSIANISARENMHQARANYYPSLKKPTVDQRISTNPNQSIETLRKFKSKLSEHAAPTPPRLRK